ncbi:uncharacterized protein MELLADRAFT_79506 [Melampsora larici-populina 98AG31]|uniref:RNA-dependent RNA polymerase n=1 Tax=Melampsora larici-populina (strain 98AG31 / pathotype 3-4-7) TaxID=747676 RepID=F4S7V6_MELLP|nr:uncharacterized protein MELLADRAFT_79506 [Melampsora larici-populina 98AG31]EGF99278.1 hypothetical protein MELLADRAFT_79506 [Melampsora larici-populina 98AG31]
MSSRKSTRREYTIVTDHPSFPDIDWIRTYEIFRACSTMRREPPAVIDPSWISCNPADICSLVTEAAKAEDPNLKFPNPAQMAKTLRHALEERLDDAMEFSEFVQQNIEYSLNVNIEGAEKKKLVIELCPPKACKSNALNRTYGAEKFLVVTLSEKVLRELESESVNTSPHASFFTQPWRIGNRVYHTVLRKAAKIYMVHINQSDSPDWSALANFMNGILDISLNKNLSEAKWVSRGSLLLSATLPTIDIPPENIRRVPDVMSNSLLVSPDFMNTIADALGLTYLPWEIPHTEGRDSPLIQLWEDHRIFETTACFSFKAYCYNRVDREFKLVEESMALCRQLCQVVPGKVGKAEIMTDGAAALSRVAALHISSVKGLRPTFLPSVYQGRIGFAKAAVNQVLASRKIPNSVFEELVDEALKSCVHAFETSDPMKLVHALSNESSISAYRKRRVVTQDGSNGIDHDPTINRTFGKTLPLESRISDQTSDKLQQFSLQPTDILEYLICLLEAGFSASNRLVVEKLRWVKTHKLLQMRRLSIPISLSCYVYAIPDPDSTGTRHGILARHALIWRSPCAAPIDIQKVRLVANEQLQRLYFDVLVCSTRGGRAVLSLLSGGDYDGDQVAVTWDKRLVDPFQNADPDAYDEIKEKDWFDSKLAGSIGDSLLEPYRRNPERFVKKAQEILIDELFTPSSFSAYSGRCHYILGADNDLTLTMGWIYVTCLDAAKKGLVLKKTKDYEIVQRYQKELAKLGVELEKNGYAPTPFFQKSLARNEKKCIKPYKRPESISSEPYVLEVVYETVTAGSDRYTHNNKSYDDATHGRRALDTDDDLRRLFSDQKKSFDKPHPKPGHLAAWGAAGVWNGVLKQMQREIADLQKEHAKMTAKMQIQQENDQTIQEEEHYVPEMGKQKMLLMRPILNNYHLRLSWKNAYNESEAEKQFFAQVGPVSESEENAFHQGKEGYLNGLGPDGYALLKASCAASNSNAEGYFPYDVAFREAQASVKNTYGHSGFRLPGIEHESLSPWTLESISHYAMLSKRILYNKRAATMAEV